MTGTILALMAGVAAAAPAELVSQRWAGRGVKCTHPGTLAVDKGDKSNQAPRG